MACGLASRYRGLPSRVRQSTNSVVQRLPVTAAGRGLRYMRWAKRFATFADLDEEAAFRRSYSLYAPDELVGLLSPQLRPDIDSVLEWHRQVYEDTPFSEPVNRMCLADTRMFLPGLNLTYTDRASMAASTEVRVPFVDPTVFRAAFSLRSKEKVSTRHGKLALKKVAEAWLPKEIVYRPKASFSAPLRSWVTRDLREVIDEALLRGELVETGFLNRPAVLALVEEDRAGRQDRSKQIWQLLTLELWYRTTLRAGVEL